MEKQNSESGWTPSRADACAFPTVASDPGLTIREHYAGLAMQGLLASPEGEGLDADGIAKYAVRRADALIAELARSKP